MKRFVIKTIKRFKDDFFCIKHKELTRFIINYFQTLFDALCDKNFPSEVIKIIIIEKSSFSVEFTVILFGRNFGV